MSANPKTDKTPTTNPTKYLHQYLEDDDILSTHPLRMHGAKMPVPYGYIAPPFWGWWGYVKLLDTMVRLCFVVV